jgi:acyl dehydratase
MSCMRFEDFAVGQSFTASITITKSNFDGYIAFARMRNILHKNPELAEKQGIKGSCCREGR